MSIIATVPVIEPPTDNMKERWSHWSIGERLLVVDNTTNCAWQDRARLEGWRYVGLGRNAGVSAAWNIARSFYLHEPQIGYPLLYFSSSVRWAIDLDEVCRLFAAHGDNATVADLGWHAISFAPKVLRQCGEFDECLFPGYMGDNDYGRRLKLCGYSDGPHFEAAHRLPIVERGLASCEDGRALRLGLATYNTHDCLRYYRRKHGGPPSQEQFATPFDLPVPVSFWSPTYDKGTLP